MHITRQQIAKIAAYCENHLGLDRARFRPEKAALIDGAPVLFLDETAKSDPRALLISGTGDNGPWQVTPYYLIHERPEAQAVSYMLGRELGNLAEVRELAGRLYSRRCASYAATDLPHPHPAQSKIALWVHDCLTQDLDHRADLNRRTLSGGICVSFDFGMAFMRHFYPPFYTFELDISDASIQKNAGFLLDLLGNYCRQAQRPESEFVHQLTEAYPTTCRQDLCRYYFRNYRAYLTRRLVRGRFFDNLKKTRFDAPRVRPILQSLGLEDGLIKAWPDLMAKLSAIAKNCLDLRGLDLSGADLRKADLNGADLRHTNLDSADLEKADLRGADLAAANLDRANLKNVLRD